MLWANVFVENEGEYGVCGMPVPVTAFISPSGGEFIMIMLVLIMLFGAKDAPRILRTVHTFVEKMQRAAADFRYRMMYGDLSGNEPDEDPPEVLSIDEMSDDEGPFFDNMPEEEELSSPTPPGDEESDAEKAP
jgi:Sec-independent protein translocase protein TatA